MSYSCYGGFYWLPCALNALNQAGAKDNSKLANVVASTRHGVLLPHILWYNAQTHGNTAVFLTTYISFRHRI